MEVGVSGVASLEIGSGGKNKSETAACSLPREHCVSCPATLVIYSVLNTANLNQSEKGHLPTVPALYATLTNYPKTLWLKTAIITHDFVVRNLDRAKLGDSSAPVVLTEPTQWHSAGGWDWSEGSKIASLTSLTHYLVGVAEPLTGMPTGGLSRVIVTEEADLSHGLGLQENVPKARKLIVPDFSPEHYFCHVLVIRVVTEPKQSSRKGDFGQEECLRSCGHLSSTTVKPST